MYVCVYIVFGIRGKREKQRGEEKQVEKHNCVV